MTDTSTELIQIMARHQLSKERVAEMLGVSVDAVRQWTMQPGRPKHSPCPMVRLDQIKIKLGLILRDLTPSQRTRVLNIIAHYSASSKRP